MLRRTIQCVDPVMNAFQAPQALHPKPRPAAAVADAQPASPPDEGAGASTRAATPKPAPQRPATGEDMSGWAMGGTD